MISATKIREAAFWDEEVICLSCGATDSIESIDDTHTCAVCGSEALVPPALAVLVLDNIEPEEEE